MPLDKAKARSYINGARVAYRVGVHAEFIQMGASFLEEALNQLDQDSQTTARAQNDVARIQRDLDNEKTEYRKLREQSAHSESMVALLREIAASPKGAQKKAAELLAAIAAPAPTATTTTS